MSEKDIMAKDIQDKVNELVKLVDWNERRRPENRADHTVSAVVKEDRVVVISGSAHQLEDLFVELIHQRPELRQVFENAVYRYGQRNHWKLK